MAVMVSRGFYFQSFVEYKGDVKPDIQISPKLIGIRRVILIALVGFGVFVAILFCHGSTETRNSTKKSQNEGFGEF